MGLEMREIYISSGCNKTPHAADWGSNGKICFTAQNSVALFNPMTTEGRSQIENTYFIHNDRVTSVRWVRNRSGKSVDAFLSTSADRTCVLSSLSSDSKFTTEAVLKGHDATVSVSDGIIYDSVGSEYIPESTPIIIATASVDSSVKIWTRDQNKSFESVDSLNFGTGFVLDVRITVIANAVLIACAADDKKVHLFARNCGKFRNVYSISGHEDWVRSIDFCYNGDALFLATGSQDTFVRVYRLRVKKEHIINNEPSNLNFVETEEVDFFMDKVRVGLGLETVLMGHENWVYGVSFNRSSNGVVKLLTSSMDKTVVVWEPRDGLWLETARVGEVGGNTLGFYGGKFSADGQCILAHGYQGSFHIWRCVKDDLWEPQVVVGGHLGEVLDLCWSPNGRYLLTVGTDQTTRLHAQWNHDNIMAWHEIARPQVHGHDMSCIAALSDTSFVSGAEEKVVRAFRAPGNFLDNFKRICGRDVSDTAQNELPEGAAVPALGLSNKPVFHDNTQSEPETFFAPLHLTKPPTEENLLQNTLWPEVQKLYGHGYEIHCIAANSDGSVIASACHATNTEHAAVILWDSNRWVQIQKLVFHRLTVTQMSFSPDGKYFVTVSRDRRWCLYKRDENSSFVVHNSGEKSPHTRIIWCCAWNSDGSVFATGSRDGVVCIWDRETGQCLCHINLGCSVTALAFSLTPYNAHYLLLAGTETGSIFSYLWTENTLKIMDNFKAHASTIQRIQFRPNEDFEFATCSKDASVRIFKVNCS